MRADIPSQMEYDLLHLDAVLSWIKGTYSNGTASDGKPWNLFGTTLQVRAACWHMTLMMSGNYISLH